MCQCLVFPKSPSYEKLGYLNVEEHFDDSDFVISRSFAASVEFNEKFNLQLKPDAIPSLIPEPKSTCIPLRKKKKSPRKSKAVAKRRRLEVNNSQVVLLVCVQY